MSAEAKFSPQDIYDAILPGRRLTPEQVAAVQAPAGPQASLVVAGAGSGKTELMSVRVLWLVANGLAKPEQILGLTFTRKAAGELSSRIYRRLQQLQETKLWPQGLELLSPKISTYNAYANNLFREYSLLIGLEAESSLLTAAGAFQMIKRLLLNQVPDLEAQLEELDVSLTTIIERIIALNQELTDNRARASQIATEIDSIRAFAEGLPRKRGGSDFSPYSYIEKFFAAISQTPLLAELAERFRQQKLDEGFVDYADQIAFALDAVEKHPELVVATERERFTHVLLDEYQDTSYLQTKLLQSLYRNHSVIAVGDPNQSIYGWRGASSSNLASFGHDFGSGFGLGPEQVRQFRLQTSWRNPKLVLQVANDLALPLVDQPSYLRLPEDSGSLEVATLQAKPDAGDGVIEIDYFETVHQEAEAVAQWFRAKFDAAEKPPTAAVLLRDRNNMPIFLAALEAKRLQVEAVGLGGLLETPEVIDLISALRVVHTPNSGNALLRLLAGPRWRLGARDLKALSSYASAMNRRAVNRNEQKVIDAPEDSSSIVDALDDIWRSAKLPPADMSDEGFERLQNAGRFFSELRRQTGLPLVDFVTHVMQQLWLDIEVQANPNKVDPMANLNAFFEKVETFNTNNSHPTVGGLVEWLDFLASNERNEIPTATEKVGVVQVLTIHGSKGLEWNYVAIPEMRTPDSPTKTGWLAAGKLPYQLRGDSLSLPSLQLEGVTSQTEFNAAQEQFKNEVGIMLEREQRRVMYVAVTRPIDELFVSGSYWKPVVKKPAEPNGYFGEIALSLARTGHLSQEKLAGFSSGPDSIEQPISASDREVEWPLDPLGAKHAEVFHRRAAEVRHSISGGVVDHALRDQIEQLLAEQASQAEHAVEVELPVRIPASNFHKYIHEFETTVEAALRPMPEKPHLQSLIGTEFHGWLEAQFGRGAVIDIDSLEDEESLDESTALNISDLKKTFASSGWAGRSPTEVEVEIQVSIGANTFICKLDAVFETDSGYEIVDWKTGAAPKDEKDTAVKALQLALYRMAYSRYRQLPAESIDACLYYITENKVVRPRVQSEAEVIELWNQVLAKTKND